MGGQTYFTSNKKREEKCISCSSEYCTKKLKSAPNSIFYPNEHLLRTVVFKLQDMLFATRVLYNASIATRGYLGI